MGKSSHVGHSVQASRENTRTKGMQRTFNKINKKADETYKNHAGDMEETCRECE